MKQTGRIVKIEKKILTIEFEKHEACTKCCSCSAGKIKRIEVPQKQCQNFLPGERVDIEINSARMLKVYILLYGLPLIIFTAIICVIYFFTNSSIKSFLAALTATIITYLILGVYIKTKEGFSSEIVVKKLF
ncbi:MAG: SoxR reducing system RseC family protein [Candidatus Omnitrophota bacterium]